MGPKLSVALNAYCTMKFEIRFRDSWITRKIRGSFKVFETINPGKKGLNLDHIIS